MEGGGGFQLSMLTHMWIHLGLEHELFFLVKLIQYIMPYHLLLW